MIETKTQSRVVDLIANSYREPILNGNFPPLGDIVILALYAAASLYFGLWYFRRLKTYFTDRI